MATLAKNGRAEEKIAKGNNDAVRLIIRDQQIGVNPEGRAERALDLAHDSGKLMEWQANAAAHLTGLTPRQQDVMERVLAGHPSKNIAADLGISQRTVENHRASIMKRTGSKSLPGLARLAFLASGGEEEPRQAR